MIKKTLLIISLLCGLVLRSDAQNLTNDPPIVLKIAPIIKNRRTVAVDVSFNAYAGEFILSYRTSLDEPLIWFKLYQVPAGNPTITHRFSTEDTAQKYFTVIRLYPFFSWSSLLTSSN